LTLVTDMVYYQYTTYTTNKGDTVYEQTRYYGVSIQVECMIGYGNRYWITDDRGNQVYCGMDKPTEQQIDTFVSCYK
jgi:hypothetical protein